MWIPNLDSAMLEAQSELLAARMALAELKAAHDYRLALRKQHGTFPYGPRRKGGAWRNGWR